MSLLLPEISDLICFRHLFFFLFYRFLFPPYRKDMNLNGIHIVLVFVSAFVVCKAMYLPNEDDDLQSDNTETGSEYRGGDISLQKRRVLSVRGDLRALARMLRFQQNKRRQGQTSVLPSHTQLIGLGKRNDLTVADDEENRIKRLQDAFNSVVKRQRLSINGALHSLSDMLASSGRTRLSEEVSSNKNRLMHLGRK